MTDQEIKPYLGKAVRVTLADRRVLAGVLHASDESGHGHRHYAIVSDAIREGGHAASFKGSLYSVVLAHIRQKFLSGSSIGLATLGDLVFTWKMLPQIRQRLVSSPGLISGIIEYGD